MSRVVVACVLAAALVASCGSDDGDADSGSNEAEAAEPQAATATPEPAADPAEVGANQLGEIPVLMYHRLLEDGGGDFDRTPEGFRAELEWLFANDYVPVLMRDVIDGAIDVPAGTSPVVLTFDDSPLEHAQLDADGEPEPDTALGILEDVAAEHADVDPVAVWSVLPAPFGGVEEEGARIMAELHERGHELANHTCRHEPLSGRSQQDVADDIACGEAIITDAVPEAEVRTFTLPLGVWPDEQSWAWEGSGEDGDYAYDAVLLVGAHPSPSPFDADFDPHGVPRIRSGTWDGDEPDYESEFWLLRLEEAEPGRYVSDGDPDTVAFPAGLSERLAEQHEERATPYEP